MATTAITDKDTLIKILSQLDSADDTHWTDDGLPRVDVVQELANDKTITRAQLNDAAPGFARIAEAAEGAPAVKADAPIVGVDHDDFDASLEPEVNGPGEQLTEDEVKAILVRRVNDAEAAVEQSRLDIAEANAEFNRNTKRVDRAKADLNRRFPPLSVAANIKAHLASQQEQLHRKVTGEGMQSRGQLDVAMERRNSRGWSRPSRPVNNSAA